MTRSIISIALGICLLGVTQMASAAPVGTGFLYQGELKDNGSPAGGDFDMAFGLYDDAVAGSPVGSLVTQVVTVSDGLFAVELDFGGVIAGTQLWLEIRVRPDGNPNPRTVLTPRQKLTATPVALYALTPDGHSLDAADGAPTDALFVDDTGWVGIGTNTPSANLHVRGTDGVKLSSAVSPPTLTLRDDADDDEFKIQFSRANDELRIGDANQLDSLVVQKDGNVGIGTTTPTSKLQVNGTVTATAFVGDGSGLTGISTADGHSLDAADGNPVDALFVDNGGFVGIGTTSPTSPLSFRNADERKITFGETAPIGLFGIDLLSGQLRTWAGLAGHLTFGHDNGAGGFTERMRINNNGRVGIGTTTPGSSLHIDSSTNWPTAILTSASTTGTWLRLDNTTTGGRSWNLISSGEGNGEGAGKLLFNDQSGGGTRMLIDDNGNLGIGTTSPEARLSIANGGVPVGITQGQLGTSAMELTTRDASGSQPTRLKINALVDNADIEFYSGARGAETQFAQFDDAGEGGRMNLKDAAGVNRVNAQATASGGQVEVRSTDGSDRANMWVSSDDAGVVQTYGPNGVINAQMTYLDVNQNHGFIGVYGAGGVKKAAMFVNELGQGEIETDILQLLGGADIAEPFHIQAEQELKPGMVVSIDPDNAGQLRLATEAYDKTVAGVISGAGGVNPAMTLQQKGTIADGDMPVALTGRVYVYVDADSGPVKPGDLLTTSNTPGHAMRVADHDRAHGAIIGKAMTALEDGKGLVLVLVSLH